MKGKEQPRHPQLNFFNNTLIDLLDPRNPVLLLAKEIPWDALCERSGAYYSDRGRPAKPIRLMIGLLLLKYIFDLSDEALIKTWIENPYHQRFCGLHEFQWKAPCDPSDMTYFRNRIGKEGCGILFKLSVDIHGDDAKESEVIIDSTVQEKEITFPTDDKLHGTIIKKCRKIAKDEGIGLRRSYTREEKALLRTIRFSKGKKTAKKKKKAKKRLKTIAGDLVRELGRKLSDDAIARYKDELGLFERVLAQEKGTKNKVYSLHEPQVVCIAKGKKHKKYEFGSKASIAMTKMSAIIVGVASFTDNIYDGDTLSDTLDDIRYSTGLLPDTVYTDRGYRGRGTVQGVTIKIPGTPKKNATQKEKKKARVDFGRRSAIEPVIGHCKKDHRLCRNKLKGAIGDAINLLMAATAFNMKKWMRRALALCLFFVLQKGLVHRWERSDAAAEVA